MTGRSPPSPRPLPPRSRAPAASGDPSSTARESTTASSDSSTHPADPDRIPEEFVQWMSARFEIRPAIGARHSSWFAGLTAAQVRNVHSAMRKDFDFCRHRPALRRPNKVELINDIRRSLYIDSACARVNRDAMTELAEQTRAYPPTGGSSSPAVTATPAADADAGAAPPAEPVPPATSAATVCPAAAAAVAYSSSPGTRTPTTRLRWANPPHPHTARALAHQSSATVPVPYAQHHRPPPGLVNPLADFPCPRPAAFGGGNPVAAHTAAATMDGTNPFVVFPYAAPLPGGAPVGASSGAAAQFPAAEYHRVASVPVPTSVAASTTAAVAAAATVAEIYAGWAAAASSHSAPAPRATPVANANGKRPGTGAAGSASRDKRQRSLTPEPAAARPTESLLDIIAGRLSTDSSCSATSDLSNSDNNTPERTFGVGFPTNNNPNTMPQTPLESRLLAEVLAMGCTNRVEILVSIRKLADARRGGSGGDGEQQQQDPQLQNAITSEDVLCDILLTRDEANFARDMDAARLLSERDRRKESEERRKANAARHDQELLSASVTEWTESKDMFRGSWLLKSSCRESILLHVTDVSSPLKKILIELLKLERQSRKWYGQDLPRYYFDGVLAEKLLPVRDAEALEAALKRETDYLVDALMLLSNQEGCAPLIFLEAKEEWKKRNGGIDEEDDDEVIMIECRKPATLPPDVDAAAIDCT